MKISRFVALLIFSLFAFSVIPAAVQAEEKPKAKQSEKAAKAARLKCEKRAGLYTGFAKDIENWGNHYYNMPTDLSAYPRKVVPHINGEPREAQLSEGSVTIVKDGKPITAKKTNYALVLKRHQGTSPIAAAKVDVTSYNAKIGALGAAIQKAQASNASLLAAWNKDFANVHCGKGEGHHKAKELIKLRASTIKKMKADLKSVQAASKDTTKAYRDVAREYKKKVQAEKKATPSTTKPKTGGTLAP